MREIQFRAWENGQMYYQVQAGGFKDTAPTIYVEKNNVYEWVNSTSENPVMQFTGLKDKNEKEIYEGDILQHHKYKEIVEVYWQQDSCGFCLKSDGGTWNAFLGGLCSKHIEIIGNVWEHPHLLAPEKQTVECEERSGKC